MGGSCHLLKQIGNSKPKEPVWMMVFFGSSVLSHNIESHQIHKLELRFKELLFNLAGNSCEDLPSEQALSVSVPVTTSPVCLVSRQENC